MENISKLVLSQTDGKILGYILDVALDFENLTLKGYYLADEETEGEYFISLSDILAVSEKYVMIENALKMEFVTSRPLSLLNREVLDDKCISFGKIRKLEFFKRKCVKFMTEKCEILTKYVKYIGSDVIFVGFKRKQRKIEKKEFPVFSSEDFVVKTLSNPVSKPEKINLSTNFYIGKVCLQDILGYNNERIISKGETITKATVEKAKKHNRLNQLFFALKR